MRLDTLIETGTRLWVLRSTGFSEGAFWSLDMHCRRGSMIPNLSE